MSIQFPSPALNSLQPDQIRLKPAPADRKADADLINYSRLVAISSPCWLIT